MSPILISFLSAAEFSKTLPTSGVNETVPIKNEIQNKKIQTEKILNNEDVNDFSLGVLTPGTFGPWDDPDALVEDPASSGHYTLTIPKELMVVTSPGKAIIIYINGSYFFVQKNPSTIKKCFKNFLTNF